MSSNDMFSLKTIIVTYDNDIHVIIVTFPNPFDIVYYKKPNVSGSYGKIISFGNTVIKYMKYMDENNFLISSTIRELNFYSIYKHRNIADIFFKHIDTNRAYIMIEKGKTLLDWLDENSVSETIKHIPNIMGQLLRVLAFFQINNICHQDIKPSNILYDGKTLKLIDFGSCVYKYKYTDYSLCTEYYRPPEAFDCDCKEYPVCSCKYNNITNHEGDIFSAGIILIELAHDVSNLLSIKKIDNMTIQQPIQRYLLKKRQELDNIGQLYDRIKEKHGNIVVDFIKQMVKIDYKDRGNALKIMNHPYFDKYKNKYKNNFYKISHRHALSLNNTGIMDMPYTNMTDRKTVIEWMIEIGKLLNASYILSLSVSILDRVVNKIKVQKTKYTVVAIVSIIIANAILNNNLIQLIRYSSYINHMYSIKGIKDIMIEILYTLNFSVYRYTIDHDMPINDVDYDRLYRVLLDYSVFTIHDTVYSDYIVKKKKLFVSNYNEL